MGFKLTLTPIEKASWWSFWVLPTTKREEPKNPETENW
jgi:hypothetical protein